MRDIIRKFTDVDLFDKIATRSDDPNERLKNLFKIHTDLKNSYGKTYRDVKGMLEVVRAIEINENSDDPDVIEDIEKKENLEKLILDMRKATVLTYKRSIKLVEFAINELVPGTFVHEDEPLESDDRDLDDLKEDFFALATFAAAVAGAAALVPGGQGVAAFAAGAAVGFAGAGAVLELAD